MHVIGHPAVPVDASFQFFQRVHENLFPALPVRSLRKDWLSMVTPENDVIETAWNMHSGTPRHRNLLQNLLACRFAETANAMKRDFLREMLKS